MMAAKDDQALTNLINRASVRAVEAEEVTKRRATKRGPSPVPALDEHVEGSYVDGEAREITIPESYETDMRRLLKKSTRYVSYKLHGDQNAIKVTIKSRPAPRAAGKVIVQFLVRDPLETGSRSAKYDRSRWEDK
jgi:hypothetical protein